MSRCHIGKGGGGMPHLPGVRLCKPTGNAAIGQPVQSDARFIGESLLAASNLLNRVNSDGESPLTSKAVDDLPVQISRESHKEKDTSCLRAAQVRIRLQNIYNDDTRSMALEWEKRGLFLMWVEDAKAKLVLAGGKGTVSEVAGIMDIAYNSLKKYVSKNPGPHRPSQEKLDKLGKFLNRDARLLVDGPNTAPVGIDPEAWAAADDEHRAWTETLFHMGVDFSPEQRKAFLSMIQAGKAMHRSKKKG